MSSLSIICEIASAHGGDSIVLKKMLSVANSAGADWVKVQVYQFESLVAKENEQFDALKTIELQPHEWIEVIRYAENLQPRLIVEIFDLPSLQLLASEPAVEAFKIPTSDLGDKDFVEAICQLGKPIFIGVGGATFDEIDAIVEQVSAFPDVKLVLMHGIQSFPTKLEDSVLSRIRLLQQRYDCDIGFADHIDAEDAELARTLPAMAIAAGAKVIEKHLTLNRAAKGFDYYSALNPDEFSDFVAFMRQIYDAMGSVKSLELTDAEKAYRNKMKKFAVLSSSVNRGEKLVEAQIEYRRTRTPGLTRMEILFLSDSQFICDVPAGSIITKDLVF